MRALTVSDAAVVLGYSRLYVYELLRAGDLPGAYRHGDTWAIPWEAIDQYVPRPKGRYSLATQARYRKRVREARGIK